MDDQPKEETIYEEVGTPGLESWTGIIMKAYTAELRWPTCYPIYSRIRRSDPEITIARNVFATFARQVRMQFTPDEKASDDDKKFADFGNEVLDDFEGGQTQLMENVVNYVPFFGWGWWEALPGLRAAGWHAPDPEDDWESEYDDGLVGFRRFAFRDPSSFFCWDMNPRGRLLGMQQMDPPNPQVHIPIGRSLHLAYGDSQSPEGLTPLESVWRLERIKYALEIILGIGYEHAAGYLEVRSTGTLTPADKTLIKQMARSILTAQETNYAAWPTHLTGEIKDIPFAAGASLLETIRYYSILKLQLFMMQWVAMASTSGSGSYSAVQDTSSMFLGFFNAMMAGFAGQADAQIGRRLWLWNKDRFPGITRRPHLTVSAVEKQTTLTELVALVAGMVDQLGPEDWTAIRAATNLLSKKLPESQEGYVKPEPKPEPAPPGAPADNGDGAGNTASNGDAAAEPDQVQQASLQSRWARYLLQHPETIKDV